MRRQQGAPGGSRVVTLGLWERMRCRGWIVRTHASPSSIRMPFGAQLVRDRRGALVILLPSASALQYAERENPDVKFLSIG